MQAALIGLGIAIVVAVPVGVVLGLADTTYRATVVIIEFLRPIPSVALIPLAILIYGRGTEMKVSLVVFACVWPILFNTIYGMHAVDPVAADTAKVFGLGRLQTSARVHLRSASPFIFTGIKIAAGIAVILAVSAELLAGGSEGIGIRMLESASVGDQLTVYAITIVAGLLGLAARRCPRPSSTAAASAGPARKRARGEPEPARSARAHVSRDIALQVGVVVAVLVGWNLATRWADSLFFPPPREIFAEVWNGWISPWDDTWRENLAPSLTRLLGGFVLAAVMSIALGVAHRPLPHAWATTSNRSSTSSARSLRRPCCRCSSCCSASATG